MKYEETKNSIVFEKVQENQQQMDRMDGENAELKSQLEEQKEMKHKLEDDLAGVVEERNVKKCFHCLFFFFFFFFFFDL